MSDEKMVTERDAVLRERAASARARCAAMHQMISTGRVHTTQGLDHAGYYSARKGVCEECTAKAGERFPLPKVTRLRVVVDPHLLGVEWHVVNGCVLENRRVVDGARFPWFAFDHGGGIHVFWRPTPLRLALWNDLLANPTEEVDDE